MLGDNIVGLDLKDRKILYQLDLNCRQSNAQIGKKVGISQARLRNLAINSDFIKLEIHSREGDPKKIMTKCPVCKHSLKNVKNQTIWGGKVTLEFKCTYCGYWTGKKKRIPTRYVFHKK